jgi:hypothetical protein
MTTSGAAKHCGVCGKKISSTNWSKHVKSHEGMKVDFVKCNGESC